MKLFTTGKGIAFVAASAVLVLLALCGPAQAAGVGGGVRGAATQSATATAQAAESRRLGRTRIRSTDWLKGFRALESKGVCSTANILAQSPSYDYIKLGADVADGRKSCRRVCDAVKCPAFNYIPAGYYFRGNYWWMPLRYRATPECIIYHDYGSQLPGSYYHHEGPGRAFDFVPTTASWFFKDWNWANGECFISNWRDNLIRRGGNKRRLGLWQKYKNMWKLVTGKGAASLRDGAYQTNLYLAKRARDIAALPAAHHPDPTGIPQLDNMVQASEDMQGGYHYDNAGFDDHQFDARRPSLTGGVDPAAKVGPPTNFYEYTINMFNKVVGTLVTQHEVDAYCLFYEWWMDPLAGPEGATKVCDASQGASQQQWRVGQAFHPPRHIRADSGIEFGVDNERYFVNPVQGVGIHGSGHYGT